MAHAEYHAKWYLPAIRELAARSDFQADPDWIAAKLVPNITVKQAPLSELDDEEGGTK